MAKKENDKVECQYCGNEYSKAGIANHEKACPENPENQVEETVEEVVEPVVEVAKKPVKLVEVKLADKVECYIGDRYYRFAKGEEAKVSVEVKDILKRAGLLEAL